MVMERYFRALQEYMNEVQSFQKGGAVQKENIPDDLVRQIAASYGIFLDPKQSKNLTPEERQELISAMNQLGVSVEQFARAINRPVDYIRKFIAR
jgi:adenylosuccinate lyase